MSNNVNPTKIPNRLENSSLTHPYVTGAKDIYDDEAGKPQSQINEELEAAVEDTYRKNEVYNKEESYNKTQLNNMITTPQVQYVTVEATSETTDVHSILPEIGAADTVYRVGNWDGTQYNVTCYTKYGWDGTDYVALATESQVDEVFDISVYRATGGTPAQYADLAAALDGGDNIPVGVRKGGMRVNFIESSSGNYAQYRLLSDTFSAEPADWSLCDDSVLVDNPEYLKADCDADGQLLFWIKADGSIGWAKGVPEPIKEYIASVVEVIITLLNGKVDKELGMSLINAVFASAQEVLENTEWLQVTTDNSGAFLEGTEKATGKKRYATQEMFDVEDDSDYLLKIVDKGNRVALGIRKNLQLEYFGEIPQKTKDYISAALQNVNKDTIAQNKHLIQNIYAAAKYNVPNRDKCLQFMTIADSHNAKDSVKRAIKASNYLRSVDAILYLGDMAGWTYKDTIHGTLHDGEEMLGLLSDSIKPYFLVCGNHDVGMSRYLYYTRTHEEVYNFLVKPMIDKGFLQSGEYQTTGEWEDRCYYYHDFNTSKIRLIVLYEYGMRLALDDNEYWEPVTYNASYGDMVPGTTYTYDSSNPIVLNCGAWKGNSFRLKKTVTLTANPNGDQNGGTWPWWKMRNFQMFEKTQMEWLINRLNDTPDGYGIVIASHQSLLFPVDTTDYKFSIGSDPDNAYHPRNHGPGEDIHIDVPIVSKIVGAWMDKSLLNERVAARDITVMGENGTYRNTETDEQGDYMYKITHDFSQRTNNNAHFINFICGHEHCDIIERSREFPEQLEVIVTCSGPYQRFMNDMPNELSLDSPAYDQLTVYSCDKNRIALCKWGCTRTVAGIDRDFEIIKPSNN